MVGLGKDSVKLLKAKNIAYIATINRDGSPHLTPVWVDTDGKNVLINTRMGRVKERNIARDSRVAVSLHDPNGEGVLSMDGRVTKMTKGKRATEHIEFLARKYTDGPFEGPSDNRVILVIAPTRIRMAS